MFKHLFIILCAVMFLAGGTGLSATAAEYDSIVQVTTTDHLNSGGWIRLAASEERVIRGAKPSQSLNTEPIPRRVSKDKPPRGAETKGIIAQSDRRKRRHKRKILGPSD